MATINSILPVSLLDLLSNDLILRHTSPYIGVHSLVSLAATSRAYKSLVYNTPQVFQHVDIHGINPTIGLNQGHRIRDIFTFLEDRNVVQHVRTLVLDNLLVPITVMEDLLCNERYQIRLLSLRGVYAMDVFDFSQVLNHLIRPSRPRGTPKLQGLYLFGKSSRPREVYNFDEATTRSEATGITASLGAQLGAGNHTDYDLNYLRKPYKEDPYSNSPYGALGPWNPLRSLLNNSDWADILEACARLIAFDAVLCRHSRESVLDHRPQLATIRLTGCISCGTCPEGPAYPGNSPADHLPLLSPPPLHSSKLEVAQRIDTNGQPYPPLILRCRICLKDRWCERCNVWWCESCYTTPKNRSPPRGDTASTMSGLASNEDIKVHNGLCVSKCLMDELLNGAGEGGMWG